VSCWGYGYGGPFLDGESTQLVPTAVKGVSNIVQIAGYGSHVCGVRSDGQGWCWGSNFSAQLGTGGPTGGVAPLPPGQVVGVDGLAEVAVGFEHSCARRSGDKRVWCWGSHFQGQLGNGETSFGASPPVLAEGLEGVEQIAAAGSTSCALSTGGALFCWGSNSDGQFGNGSSSSKAVPRPVASPGTTGFARLALSGDSACATRGDGALFCWGTNTQGKLGLGPSADSPLPVRVFGVAK
jgi:alpha-tubulin suppressor-like RCC1 family protein